MDINLELQNMSENLIHSSGTTDTIPPPNYPMTDDKPTDPTEVTRLKT